MKSPRLPTGARYNRLYYTYVNPSISISLSLYLSLYVSLYLYVDLSLSLSLSIYLSVYLSVCLSTYLPIYLSIYLSICLSIYISIYIYLAAPKSGQRIAFGVVARVSNVRDCKRLLQSSIYMHINNVSTRSQITALHNRLGVDLRTRGPSRVEV